MDSRLLVGKIGADKNSKKLGKVIRIELLTGKTVKITKPYAMILVSKPFRKDVIVPIAAEKLLKYDTHYAWFDISKEEFEEEAKQAMNIKNEREKYSGQIPQQKMSNQFWTGVDYTGLSKAPKERKR